MDASSALDDDGSDVEDEQFHDENLPPIPRSQPRASSTAANASSNSSRPTPALTIEQVSAQLEEVNRLYHALQLDNSALKKQLTEADIATMNAQYRLLKNRKSKRKVTNTSTANQPPLTEEEEEALKSFEELVEFMGHCGRVYGASHCPWVEEDLIDSMTSEEPDINPKDAAQRLPDDRSKVSISLARQAEAFKLIASNTQVRQLLGQAEWMGEEFHRTCLDQKCKGINAMVSEANYVLADYNFTPARLEKPESRRAYLELQALKPTSSHDTFCPAMYPVDRVGQHAWLFRGHAISACIRVMLCGPKCRSSAAIHPNSRAAQWKLKEITPGMVAFAATALVFLISGDAKFVPRSDPKYETSFDYVALFMAFEALLFRSLHTRNTQELLAWLTRIILGIGDGPTAAPASQDDDEDDINAARARNEAAEQEFMNSVATDSPPQVTAPLPQPEGSLNTSSSSSTQSHTPSTTAPPPRMPAPQLSSQSARQPEPSFSAPRMSQPQPSCSLVPQSSSLGEQGALLTERAREKAPANRNSAARTASTRRSQTQAPAASPPQTIVPRRTTRNKTHT